MHHWPNPQLLFVCFSWKTIVCCYIYNFKEWPSSFSQSPFFSLFCSSLFDMKSICSLQVLQNPFWLLGPCTCHYYFSRGFSFWCKCLWFIFLLVFLSFLMSLLFQFSLHDMVSTVYIHVLYKCYFSLIFFSFIMLPNYWYILESFWRNYFSLYLSTLLLIM